MTGMSSSTRRPAAPKDPVARVLSGVRAFGAALRDVWQGYWDRPIGC
jgi:hypothetical protein